MDIDITKTLSALKALGLTQSKIASEIDCSQPAISDYSKGKIGKARPSHKFMTGLAALATKHGISLVAKQSKSTRTTSAKKQRGETVAIQMGGSSKRGQA